MKHILKMKSFHKQELKINKKWRWKLYSTWIGKLEVHHSKTCTKKLGGGGGGGRGNISPTKLRHTITSKA